MKALEVQADEILVAANDNTPAKSRIRFRGGRPAWNWLKKQDEKAAAALWLVARRMLAEAANDNQSDAAGMGVDRRKNGRPRGKDPTPMSPREYLALPAVLPRLGDADEKPVQPRGFHGHYDLKPQEWTHPDAVFTEATCLSWHPTEIAEGASFLGAQRGLGQPKVNKIRGDVRRVDEPDLPAMPEHIAKTVEAMLARADLAGIGKAHGYKGSYADRPGRKAMLEAGRWALTAIAA